MLRSGEELSLVSLRELHSGGAWGACVLGTRHGRSRPQPGSPTVPGHCFGQSCWRGTAGEPSTGCSSLGCPHCSEDIGTLQLGLGVPTSCGASLPVTPPVTRGTEPLPCSGRCLGPSLAGLGQAAAPQHPQSTPSTAVGPQRAQQPGADRGTHGRWAQAAAVTEPLAWHTAPGRPWEPPAPSSPSQPRPESGASSRRGAEPRRLPEQLGLRRRRGVQPAALSSQHRGCSRGFFGCRQP